MPSRQAIDHRLKLLDSKKKARWVYKTHIKMLRKKEKKAIASIIALLIGWPVGLDKFLEGKSKRGFQIFIGWLITGIAFSFGLYQYTGGDGIGLLIFSLIAISIGTIFFLSELVANLRMFEEAED